VATSRIYRGADLRLGRFSEAGRPYLVTTVTRYRRPVFREPLAAMACARALHHTPGEAAITSLAWVIMPDHVHWLLTLNGDSLHVVLRKFKSRAARAVNAALDSQGPFWQRGYHDRALRRDADLPAAARYIVANPVRAGLCERVMDYPYWDAVWVGQR